MAGKFELKPTKNDGFMFNLKAGNGQVILTSEIYNSKAAALNGIESVKKNAADLDKFEARESKNGEPYFVLKAGNGQEIGRSEMYSGTSAMENGIASVNKNAPDADVVELEA
ncbi:YegP family protein [Leeia sp. TBRC 13508]|uniref:YegP family protein n=1 Tax=Leeia speluncae TaxID=2884804 RepID=A0ABS8D4J7_9NEIS|nr:YegP family protein [Leeia speluncae]MCB6183134.1 YegP family protein [Leeia speluncae]